MFKSAFKILKCHDEMNYVKIYIKVKHYYNKLSDLYWELKDIEKFKEII